MKKLIGTEKQVAWAEDIRERYALVASKLEEAIATLADTRMEATAKKVTDLFGNETDEEEITYTFVTTLSAEQKRLPESAHEFLPTYEQAGMTRKARIWDFEKLPKASTPQEDWLAERGRQYRYYSAVLANLQHALAEEDSAKFWIDRR